MMGFKTRDFQNEIWGVLDNFYEIIRLDEFIALLSPVHSGKCDAQVISTNKQGFPAPVCITASYQQTALLTNTKWLHYFSPPHTSHSIISNLG